MFWPEDCRSFTNKLIFEMDTTALFSISYGLYIVGTMDGRRPVGCTINTCFQVTSENPLLAISLNKNNYTLDAIRRNKRFSLSVVAEDTDNLIIATFGFSSSRTVDKYEDFGYRMLRDVPIVNGKFCSRLVLDVVNFVDCETHVVVVARLIDAVKEEGVPMTYEYYHRVVKGKAPKNAPTYVDEAAVAKPAGSEGKRRYVCDICGYVVETDEPLPQDYVCPVCKADRSHFAEK